MSQATIPVLFATMTGNSRDLAERTARQLKDSGFEAEAVDMVGVKPEDLSGQSTALFVVSTWGEGEPPDDGVPYVERLQMDDPLNLAGLDFSVCALGDTNYEIFCGCGKIIDERLEKHGGSRLAPRADCDVDFEEPFENWLASVVAALEAKRGVAA